VTTFDKKQCDELLKLILSQGLLRIQVNRHLPRVMVHGPVAYQGLNIPNLHTEQMLLHVQILVKYGSQMEDPMELLIQANVELLRLETGMSGPVFQIHYYFYPCVSQTWVSHCWYYCIQHSIDILTDTYDLSQPDNKTKNS